MSGQHPAGCRHKLVLVTADRDLAQTTAMALAEIIEPAADAVAVFELPGPEPQSPPAGWRVDAYFIGAPDAAGIAAAIAGPLNERFQRACRRFFDQRKQR